MTKITLVNQVTGPLFIDIVNAYHRAGVNTRLHTGTIEKTSTDIDRGIMVQKGTKYNRKSAIKRFSTWVLFTLGTVFKLLFSSKKRNLFLVSNPPTAPFIGLFFNILFKQKYFVLIYDIYPDVLIEMGYLKPSSFIVKWWSYLNNKLFSRAEKVFTISDGMQKRLLNYCPDMNIEVIHNWVDASFIKPIDKSKNWFIKKHNLETKTVILYSGNLGLTHDIESIVDAAYILRSHSDIHFLIIGSGAKESMVRKMVDEKEISNLTLLPYQPSETLPYSMTSGDIAIVTLASGIGDLSVPSKTYYMMSAGLAIVAIAESGAEIENLVHDQNIGKIVAPGSPRKLADTLLSIARNEDMLGSFKNNAVQTAQLFTPTNAEKFVRASISN